MQSVLCEFPSIKKTNRIQCEQNKRISGEEKNEEREKKTT